MVGRNAVPEEPRYPARHLVTIHSFVPRKPRDVCFIQLRGEREREVTLLSEGAPIPGLWNGAESQLCPFIQLSLASSAIVGQPLLQLGEGGVSMGEWVGFWAQAKFCDICPGIRRSVDILGYPPFSGICLSCQEWEGIGSVFVLI